jgi:hypothetical protein
MVANKLAIRRGLEAAGVEFIDENGGGSVCGSESPQKIILGNNGACCVGCSRTSQLFDGSLDGALS